LVLASAVWALFTLASALYTAACADATLPAEGAALEVLPAADPPDPEDPEEAPGVAVAPGAVVAVGVVVGGLVVLGLVAVVVGVAVLVEVVVVVAGADVVADTNWVVPEPGLGSKLVAVVEELDCAAVSCCWAAVRL
jgi:hypothetical protein